MIWFNIKIRKQRQSRPLFVPLSSNMLVHSWFKFVVSFGSNAFVRIKDRGRAPDKALGSIRRVE